jgi:Berberine and berberine like
MGSGATQFLGRREVPARVAASFGENWERLVALKKQYDPTGLFRNTFWPLDKDGTEMDPSEHEPPEVVGP